MNSSNPSIDHTQQNGSTPNPGDDLRTHVGRDSDPNEERKALLFVSRLLCGGVFMMLGVALVALVVFMIAQVINPMTKTPPITESLLNNRADDFSIDFLVSLEYTSAAIRTVGVQVAVATVGGFFLIVVGILLFSLGFLSPFGAEARLPGYELVWKNGAPGMFSVSLGMILLMTGVLRPMSRNEINFSRRSGGQSSKNIVAEISDIQGIPEDYLDAEPTDSSQPANEP